MKTRFSFRKRKRGEKSFDLLMTLFFRSDSPWSFGKWGKDVEECFDSQTDFLEGRKKKFFLSGPTHFLHLPHIPPQNLFECCDFLKC